MKSLGLVDPDFLPLVTGAFGSVSASAETLEKDRRAIDDMFESLVTPEMRPSQVLKVPRSDGTGDMDLRVFMPSGPDRMRPAIFEIHGGGFIYGSAAISDAQNFALSRDHDAVVASVDYRIAPEAAFPTPLDDCYAALAYVFQNAETLGVDVRKIAVMGASAGGGLAAALALLARDRGEFRLVAQFLIYPMLDTRTGTDLDPYNNPMAGEFCWNRESNRFGWTSMRGSRLIEDDRLGYFSPALARDLENLPPSFIAVGSLDLFVDEDIAYASRLIRSGVATELHVYPGAPHGFHVYEAADITARFSADFRSAIRRVFTGGLGSL